jgi:hypothetical protein
VLTVAVSEACYRFVETPVRKGVIGRWWRSQRDREWNIVAACAAVTTVALLVPVALFYASAESTSVAEDDSADVVFEPAPTVPATSLPSATSAPVVTAAQAPLPRRTVVVGDSQAHSLAINLPEGIDSTFTISDGSVDGCSVYDDGTAVSSRPFERSFVNCEGWAQDWADAAVQADAQIVLVVLGAWDVFDTELDDRDVPFASSEWDRRFLAGVATGVDAVAAGGAHVALLEAACMRPVDVDGAGVPALPERGDDARVAHINALLRDAAAADPERVTFVAGPTQWCNDEAIATDLGYRWDGVHVYKPGANLIYETIAPALLDITVPA